MLIRILIKNALILSLLVLPTRFIFASNIIVDSNCGFKEAMLSAENDFSFSSCEPGSGDDTVILTADTTVNESLVPVTSVISIKGNNHSVYFNNTTSEPNRVFNVPFGTLKIYDTNFINQYSGTALTEDGGFLLSDTANLYLENVTVDGFHAQSFGGAMNISNTNLHIVKSRIKNNIQISTGYILGGGAIFVASGGGNIEIEDSIFERNSAKGQGGAILRLGANFNIKNTQFVSNVADHGSAISASSWSDDGYFNLFKAEFLQNASNDGAAFVWRGPLGGVSIDRSLFYSNIGSTYGAALEIYGMGLVSVTNSTFSHNSSANGGSAIFNHVENAKLHSAFNTFANNSSVAGEAAVLSTAYATWTDSFIENSLFASNTGGDCLFYSNENMLTIGNLSANSDCGDVLATGVNLNLAQNGGGIRTHAIYQNSNAIDAAVTDSSLVRVSCLPTDQRGVVRPLDGNNDGFLGCDIGAFEYKSKPLVAPSLVKSSLLETSKTYIK